MAEDRKGVGSVIKIRRHWPAGPRTLRSSRTRKRRVCGKEPGLRWDSHWGIRAMHRHPVLRSTSFRGRTGTGRIHSYGSPVLGTLSLSRADGKTGDGIIEESEPVGA